MLDLKNICDDVITEIQSMSDAEFLNEILAAKLTFCDDCYDPLSTYQVDTLTGNSRNDDLKYPDAGVLAA